VSTSRRRLVAGLVATTALAGGPAASVQASPPKGDAPSVLQRLVWKGVPVYCGGSRGRLVALTFDDGPSPWTTRLAAALARANAPATFFLVGSRIRYWRDGVRAAAFAGDLGNHTWTHPHLLRLRPAAVARQLRLTQLEIVGATRRLPAVFRPPYEQANRRIDRIARSLGLLDVRWNVDSGDSARGASPRAVVRTVLTRARPGSIVLLHDSHPWTAGLVPALVRGLRARHLRPVALTTLLELDPPAAGGRC
jgi:peptidoglycan/xylan/chitin deacetylase (PgdA/CDA1 family)